MTQPTLPSGIFVISIDFELIWGTRDLFGVERFRNACEIERAIVIDRLLGLFVKYNVAATWCIVGHLFLDHCEITGGRKHPEVLRVQPRDESGDWFDDDPASNEREAPTFYGRELVQRIRCCEVSQEIASHSFSHVIFDRAECTRAVADSEIRKCVTIAASEGLELRSFAYPRNRVGHLDVLRECAFTSYRGPEPHWYDTRWIPAGLKRAAHLASFLSRTSPPVVLPEPAGNGFWNIPGSMILLPMHGVRRCIPAASRVSKALKGLSRASLEHKIFHLWFHPTNLAIRADAMFDALERILASAQSLRERGDLRIMTMRDVAEDLNRNVSMAVAQPAD